MRISAAFFLLCFILIFQSVQAQAPDKRVGFYASCWDGSGINEEYGELTNALGEFLKNRIEEGNFYRNKGSCASRSTHLGFSYDVAVGVEKSSTGRNLVYHPNGDSSLARRFVEFSGSEMELEMVPVVCPPPPGRTSTALHADAFICDNTGPRIYLQIDFSREEVADVSENILEFLYDYGVPPRKGPGKRNIKDNSKYSEKEVFLISDREWRNVLGLVPTAVWTDFNGKVHNYPSLIFHEEEHIIPFVSMQSENKLLKRMPPGSWQSFVAGDDFISEISVRSRTTIPRLELRDEMGNLIAESDAFSDEYDVIKFSFNADVKKGQTYRVVFPDAVISFAYLDNPYKFGEYSENPEWDIAIEVYGEDYTPTFDADSIIHFLQQYGPSRVTIIGETPQQLDSLLVAEPGLGAGLAPSQIQRIEPQDYFSYWKSFEEVIYVEYNYELALMASSYASLINAPLIIEGSALDSGDLLTNKRVICVGAIPSEMCDVRYTLEELRREYIEATNTDKLILVNPEDLYLGVYEKLEPEILRRSSGPITELYSKDSLAAPFLAGAKHELMISTTSTSYQEVDKFIDAFSTLNPKYLTIVASPNAIEMSYNAETVGQTRRYSADSWYYSQLDENPFLDLAVGRIFGITVSDTSSNIARSLFYKETVKNENSILVTGHRPWYTGPAEVYAYGKVYSAIGYETKITPLGSDPGEWEDKFLIHYDDHGSTSKAGLHVFELPPLDNTFMLTLACLTCDFGGALIKSRLFCANVIRRGGVGSIGATDMSGYLPINGFISEIFSRGSTLGEAFIKLKNTEMTYREKFYNPFPYYTLLGDPTLKIGTIHKMPAPTLNLLSESPNERTYKLVVPAMKIWMPYAIRAMCETAVPDEYYFITAYNFEFSNKKFAFSLDNVNGFEPVAIAPRDWSVVTGDNRREEFWIKSPLGDYFTTANEHEFTDFEFEITLLMNAPDLTITNLRISDYRLGDYRLEFDIKNIGGAEAVGATSIHAYVWGRDGMSSPPEETYFYDYKEEGIDVSLQPGDSAGFSVELPPEYEGQAFKDYTAFEIFVELYDTQIVETDTENNSAKVLWRG